MTRVAPRVVGVLEATLRARREEGRKLLVPYLTGGLGDDWIESLRAVAAAGADAIEIGIPFSDPVMDGVVIQEASVRALAAGTTPDAILDALVDADVDVPLVVMTYLNLVAHAGYQRMAGRLAESGVCAAILPDLPVDESEDWRAACDVAGVETVLLAAPTSTPRRLREIGAKGRGFVYAVGTMGVTGERDALADTAVSIAERVKAVTDLPVLVGVGVSTPEQAVQVCRVADGVVVGSALVRRLLAGEGPAGAGDFVASLRRALDDPA